MIAGHRRAHRLIHLALWPLATLVLSVAIASRPTTPARSERAWLAGAAAPDAGEPVWTRDDLFPVWPARVALRANGSLDLEPLRPLALPDLLLYWTPGEATAASLPIGSHLLGRIIGTRVQRFELPAAALEEGGTRDGSGWLVVYSLGHQEVVAAARWPRPSDGVAR